MVDNAVERCSDPSFWRHNVAIVPQGAFKHLDGTIPIHKTSSCFFFPLPLASAVFGAVESDSPLSHAPTAVATV